MKTFKLLQTGIAALLIAVLIGCSDSITTSGFNEKPDGSISNNETGSAQTLVSSYSSEIRLKPNQSITFEALHIGLNSIKSFSVDKVLDLQSTRKADLCQDLRITGFNMNSNRYLFSCREEKVDLTSLTIDNISSNFVTLNVQFTGVKSKGSIY